MGLSTTPSATFQVRSSIQITPVPGVNPSPRPFRSYPTNFNGNMFGSIGPTPGAVIATHLGTIVNLSLLTAFGGLCQISNNDQLNILTWGIWYPTGSLFFPVGDILPQEGPYVIRLSQYLQSEEPGTGTGTFGLSELMLRSPKNTTIEAIVEAFDP